MAFALLKKLLPAKPVPVRVLRGPFRGARVVMNPRESLRKILGLYERELNPWIAQALPRVHRVLDLGANDGFFTFGCAAAFSRLGIKGEIIGFEPQAEHAQMLRDALAVQPTDQVSIKIVEAFVGRHVADNTTTLDALQVADRRNTLIKIDVEGAEVDVLAGATTWMDPSNLFVIEVHKKPYLSEIQEMFQRAGIPLKRIDHITGGLIGGDPWRSAENWWLVSDLDTCQ